MSFPLPPLTAERRARFSHRRATRHFLLGDYRLGVFAGLVVSLALLVSATHLPLHRSPGAVYWYARPTKEQIILQMLAETRAMQASAAPTTSFTLPPLPEQSVPGDGEADEAQSAAPLPAPPRMELPERMRGHQILEFAETMPEIEGGLRSYYVHIEYPPEAAAAGIQGRLVLEFVVELDGTTSAVQVLESLHPLCDSAAVRALRETRFIPGRQHGEKTRVRMRLPVRFRLVDGPPAPQAIRQADV